MHLLYCDETNLEERSGDFFVYGGVMIDADAAPALSQQLEQIRSAAGMSNEVMLKFKPKPGNLSSSDFVALKDQVIDATVSHGCTLITCLTLHDLARDPETARLYGINSVCYHFDCLLNRSNSQGLILIDRFDNKQADSHLRDKFSKGVEGLPYSDRMRLDRVLGIHYSAIGQSHFCSVVDIILGSLRFAINSHTRGGNATNRRAAEDLLQRLSPLFPRSDFDHEVLELGLLFSPKAIRAPSYREKYQSVKDFLSANGIATKQEITASPIY